MSSAADVDVLMGLMPPPREGGALVDWDPIAGLWGRPFPPDYQRFIEVYGAGTIQDFLGVLGPQPKVPFEDAGWNGMVLETGNAEDAREDTTFKSPELEGTSPYLITWGLQRRRPVLLGRYGGGPGRLAGTRVRPRRRVQPLRLRDGGVPYPDIAG
ncbi:hypothetical protein [Amycolatopsis taiwanensis]|uniref:Knr4/Smi1-like domain-containing protein n=1 Tax=Amycolatopsis taiwanensis TaxID=342230 RepID=A0A9W6R9H6_9PSEU|nr:hypothetical protein [Amycolatopsis taiwanensis]GLY70022.1 hypothetical protein Atai01_66410 [Amycolatopsis taiwanensis]